jgi:hypothetical protein
MSGILNVMLGDNASSAVGPGSYVYLIGASASSVDSTSVQTAGINAVGSDLFVMAVGDLSSSPEGTVSDSKLNTWHPLTDVPQGDARMRLYWSTPAATEASHTFAYSGSSTYPSIAVLVFSGSHATPNDAEATGTGTSSTASAGSGITPTQNNELVIAAVGYSANTVSSISSSFIITADAPVIAFGGGSHFGVAIAYKIQTAAAAVDPDWTLSGSADWAAAIASFKGT